MSLEDLVRRDRAVVAAGLVGVILLAWFYLVRVGRDMQGMDMVAPMAMAAPWGPGELLAVFGMWAVMMVAMMLPSAAPMILLFATVNRRRAVDQARPVPVAIFVAGYLVVWAGFSALAALGQSGLQRAALLSGETITAAPWLGGAFLIAAGLWELTPLKYACLARCQSPLAFIMTEWREGPRGALVMGLRHGIFCVGCCWALMSLLFVAGVMNLLWVAAIAGLVLAQKLLPVGRFASRGAGAALLAWGVLVMTRAL